jgi:hypothetical protein
VIRQLSWPLAVLVLVVGCNKEAPAPAPAPSAAASAAPAPAATDIPTPEDFEQAALDQINPQNMEQELDKLEKDVGK